MKRGMGHVEVIISFVLFIGFLSFGLYFFNPLDNNRVLDSSLAYAFDELQKNASVDILSYTVVLNGVVPREITLPLSRANIEGGGVRVEDTTGRSLAVSSNETGISFDREANDLVYVRYGPFSSLPPTLTRPVLLTLEENFSISSSEKEEVMSEIKLRELALHYTNDYEAVKEHFNIPGRVDFSVEVPLPTGENISLTRPVPDGFDVIVRNEREKILLAEGSLVFVDMYVAVW